jgi:membrane protease YdiL (CAAX protease family)
MVAITQLLKRHPIASFVLLTLLWSFSWWTLILTVVPLGGIINSPPPAAFGYMILGGFGPTLAGLLLTRIVDGPAGLRRLFARLRHWRVGRWWLAVLIPYAINLSVFIVYGLAGHTVPVGAALGTIPAGIGMGLTAALMEEFGWRGYLLPKLEARTTPLKATLLVGLVWGGIWHLYADYIALGNLGGIGILLIVLSGPILLTAHALLMTWLYHRTQASLLLSLGYHACISSSALIFGLTYPSAEAQLIWTTFSVALTCVVAVAIIVRTGGLAPNEHTTPQAAMKTRRA